MAVVIGQDKGRTALEIKVLEFVRENKDEPIYVRDVMDRFGDSLEEKDSVRSVVWAMVSRRDLRLGNGLQLHVESNGR